MANQKRMWELADILVNRGHEYDEMDLIDLGHELAHLVLEEERAIGKMMNRLFTGGIVNEPDF